MLTHLVHLHRFRQLTGLMLTIGTIGLLITAAPVSADPGGPACYLSKSTLNTVGLSVANAQDMYNHPANWTQLPWCDSTKGVYLGDLDTNGNGIIDSLEPASTPTPTPKPTPASVAPKATPTPIQSATPAATPTPTTPSPTASPMSTPSASPTISPSIKVADEHTAGMPLIVALALGTLLVAGGLGYWLWRRLIRRH